MARRAPGKHYREGLALIDLLDLFPDDESAEVWFVKARWPDGIACPSPCGSLNVQVGAKHKTMPYRCRDCRRRFSARTGTALQGSNIGFQKWVIAIYLLATNLKGVSSMKLHRDLKVTQKTAWYLAHRLREAWESTGAFVGPVEVDETYVGGKERNKHSSKKLRAGRGPVGKTAVVGAKDRETNTVVAQVVESTDATTLQGFVRKHSRPEATVYTDEYRAYTGLTFHETVQHGVGQYVNGMAHTNGIESFWSMLKRGYHGTYHQMSAAHLDRYVGEFAGRHNQRNQDTLDQMTAMVRGLDGKRLRYQDLVA